MQLDSRGWRRSQEHGVDPTAGGIMRYYLNAQLCLAWPETLGFTFASTILRGPPRREIALVPRTAFYRSSASLRSHPTSRRSSSRRGSRIDGGLRGKAQHQRLERLLMDESRRTGPLANPLHLASSLCARLEPANST